MKAGQVCTLKGIYWRENVDGSNRLWVAGSRLELNPSARHIQVVKVPHAALHFIALTSASLLNVHHFQRVSDELLDIGGEDYVVLFF